MLSSMWQFTAKAVEEHLIRLKDSHIRQIARNITDRTETATEIDWNEWAPINQFQVSIFRRLMKYNEGSFVLLDLYADPRLSHRKSARSIQNHDRHFLQTGPFCCNVPLCARHQLREGNEINAAWVPLGGGVRDSAARVRSDRFSRTLRVGARLCGDRTSDEWCSLNNVRM